MENDQENQEKIALFKQYLENAQANINQAYNVLNKISTEDLSKELIKKSKAIGKEDFTKNTKIIEGVFDGQNMVGPDGKIYSIPPNYTSKSKLVEGDILKLTIMPDGTFLFKQIGPVERKRLVGVLVPEEDGHDYRVLANGRSYKVILASVTYFKGEAGSQAVILVPKDQDSKWAAVENVIKDGETLSDGSAMELTAGFDDELLGASDSDD
ncbi:MAG: hypothetical protein V1898_02990 [Patescibacteria group bacterium]